MGFEKYVKAFFKLFCKKKKVHLKILFVTCLKKDPPPLQNPRSTLRCSLNYVGNFSHLLYIFK